MLQIAIERVNVEVAHEVDLQRAGKTPLYPTHGIQSNYTNAHFQPFLLGRREQYDGHCLCLICFSAYWIMDLSDLAYDLRHTLSKFAVSFLTPNYHVKLLLQSQIRSLY